MSPAYGEGAEGELLFFNLPAFLSNGEVVLGWQVGLGDWEQCMCRRNWGPGLLL